MADLPRTRVPIIAAPMAGGPSTPELVAAVGDAGGLGFLAGGYLTAESLGDQVTRTRELTSAPFAVNLFVPEEPTRLDLAPFVEGLAAYAASRADAIGEVAPGEANWADDDHYPSKVDRLVADPVAVVSFTFGLPSAQDVARLQGVGTCVVASVTDRAEAEAAKAVGADALCVQGPDAGGHRATHAMADEPGTAPLLDLLAEVAPVGLPMIAAGGLATSADVAAVLERGAIAAQLGTMFLLTPEAGTNETHRRALGRRRDTVVTRSFSGRPARGLRNRWIDELDGLTPPAYPPVNHVTGPIRRAAAAAGDAESLHLWAGTGYRRAVAIPAAEVVAHLAAEL
ncbi:NAD(P)H-dependent flavin oxidoreductase [Mariniluteicoccus flavus]